MKNILFVVDEKRMGGVSVLLNDILNKINFQKYNIDVMVLHNIGDYLDKLPKNINIIYGTSFFDVVDLSIKEVLHSKNIFKILKKIYLIFLMKTALIGKKIKKERKKCLHKHYDIEIAFKDGFCALFTAYGDSDIKYHWIHTDYLMYDCTARYKSLFTKTFTRFDKIIGISKSVVKRFQDKYPNTQCEVIYNLIDEEKIKSQANIENINFNDGLNLISVGRIHNMKGYDRLVRVFNRLNMENKLDNVYLRIIGNGPDMELVRSLVHDFSLENKIDIMGQMKNPFPYVKASDAFIMCSRYEPFGLVILESMILDVPVISTDVASIKEIMDEKYGIITENSEDGLYNAIITIINNKSLLNKYKKNLQTFNYDTKKILKQIESLLDEVRDVTK